MRTSICCLAVRFLFENARSIPIATQLTAITRDPMAAKGLLRQSSVDTTLAHYIKEVPEVTANGMAKVEQLFSKLDLTGQAVQ